MRTIFMGTPDFAVASLDALHQRSEVVAVVCQPDKPAGRGMKLRPPAVKRRALELGLEVLQPRRVRAPSFRRRFAELAPELVVVAAYGKILPGDLLREVPRGFINVHASLLPRLRGAAPIHRAILGGDSRSGVAIMLLTEGMDEGPVYLTRATPLAPDETAGSLHDRLAELGSEALGEFLDRVLAGEKLTPEEQDHARATYAGKLEAEEFEVRWERDAEVVDRQIRGLSPFPSSFTFLAGKRLVLLASELVDNLEVPGPPGTLIRQDKTGPVIACGQGGVRVTRVKPSGKRAMAAGDWLRGARLEPGVCFGPG
jgi:methionyl-tRNA formyltransferase